VLRAIALLIGLTTAAAVSAPAAQTLVTSRNLEISMQNQLLRGAVLRSDYQPSDFLRDYRIMGEPDEPNGAYLAAYTAHWYGYRVEELSQTELALEGLGTGATMGLFMGAIGQSLGLWDEDKTWLMVGAMSALGAAWGASKVDDPSWRYRLRWDEQNSLTVPTE
jgi:hypothetical protein